MTKETEIRIDRAELIQAIRETALRNDQTLEIPVDDDAITVVVTKETADDKRQLIVDPHWIELSWIAAIE